MTIAVEPRPSRKELCKALLPFATPCTRTGVKLFAVDFLLYLLGMALALGFLTDNLVLRLVGGLLAGAKMGGLYTLGHDAGHHSLTASKRLNRVLSVLAYLPSLYNARLWHYDHQARHHAMTNGPQLDVFQPMSLQAYQAAPGWRRWLERCVRAPNPLSLVAYVVYYTRIATSKVLPVAAEYPPAVRKAAWPIVPLVVGYACLLLGTVVVRNIGGAGTGWLVDIVCLLVPFYVFQLAVGFAVYLQHTHTSVPWFAPGDNRHGDTPQEDLTISYALPRWLGHLMHDSMSHSAHHILPAVPCYRLHAAQCELDARLGRHGVRATLSDIPAVVRGCKLYDYQSHQWLDFEGQATGPNLLRSRD